mmetsp:Transcript_41178/g.76673  ORF Transcript_41178/g.76673 Transcript_41178/m.76673 type:complete len:135 (-) Transcript_41178:110-514(-)
MAFRFICVFALTWAVPLFAQHLQARSLSTSEAQAVCIRLSFNFGSRCTYDDILYKMEGILEGYSEKCSHTAVQELNLHLGVSTQEQAEAKIRDICKNLQDKHFKWSEIISYRGDEFDKRYFAVGGWSRRQPLEK